MFCLHFPGVRVDRKALQEGFKCIFEALLMSTLSVLSFYPFFVKRSFAETFEQNGLLTRDVFPLAVYKCLADQLENSTIGDKYVERAI